MQGIIEPLQPEQKWCDLFRTEILNFPASLS